MEQLHWVSKDIPIWLQNSNSHYGICFTALCTYWKCFNGTAPLSIQRYTYMIAEYIGTVTIHTMVVIATCLNCLNGTAQLSIQRYTHMTAEYIGIVTTNTKAACVIAMGTQKNCQQHCSTEYSKIYPYDCSINRHCLFNSHWYSFDLFTLDSSNEYPIVYPYDCRIYRHNNY